MLDEITAFFNFLGSNVIQSTLGYCFLLLMLPMALFLSSKFVRSELGNTKSSHSSDPLITTLAGTLLSIVCCAISIKIISLIFGNKVTSELAFIMLFVAGISSLTRAITMSKITSKYIAGFSETESHRLNSKVYRMALIIFTVATVVSVPISVCSPHSKVGMLIAHITSVIVLLYYLLELYISRKITSKCFVIKRYSGLSMGSKVASFINDKLNFFSLLAMSMVLIINSQSEMKPEILMLHNIIDMVISVLIVYGLQLLTTTISNKISQKIEALKKQKALLISVKSRQTGLIWINNILISSVYAVATLMILGYIRIGIYKYIIHDSVIVSVITILITVLLYHSFQETSAILIQQIDEHKRDRMLTFMPVVSVIFNVVVVCSAVCIVLSQWGIAVIPLFASFTAVSAAIAFAAQDIIKSFLQGIILLCENNFYVGDFVTIDGTSGTVKRMATRVIVLQDICGDEHIIPYNTIKQISNHSKDHFTHVESLLLDPYTDISKACNLLMQIGRELRQDPNFGNKIFTDISISGMQNFTSEGIKVRWSFQTSSDIAGRLMNLEVYKRLFELFKKENIKIPYDQEMAAIVTEQRAHHKNEKES